MKHSGYCARLILAATVCLASPALAGPELAIDKTVSPRFAGPGQSVDFTITVRNDGDVTATNVHVTDMLPTGLSAPVGTTPFASSGTYDAATGDWSIGDIAAGTRATLVLPAQVDSAPPLCIINTATLEPDASDPGRSGSAAAVARAGARNCADVAVSFANFEVSVPACANQASAQVALGVRNNGPDAARSVAVDIRQTPELLPVLFFTDAECSGQRRCNVAVLLPGEARVLSVESAPFSNPAAVDVSLVVSASTDDIDLASTNDAIVQTVTIPQTVASNCAVPDTVGSGSVNVLLLSGLLIAVRRRMPPVVQIQDGTRDV